MIIPIFLMNRGCPHRCLFCNERLTAGDRPETITAEGFNRTVRTCLASRRPGGDPVEIAFYGGTFTGLSRPEQARLLALAAPFLAAGSVRGIRISTRPDEIEGASLAFLKEGGVATVELGTQSLDDAVLSAAGRGHSAEATLRAHALLRAAGIRTGIHLMAGLPGDTPAGFARTVAAAIALRPDTVRLHPTLVLKDTGLAEAFQRGRYRPLTLAQAVSLCKEALKAFAAVGIPVIRLGLQTTAELETPGSVLAGPFHPAFRSLVEAEIFLEMALALLAEAGWERASEALPCAGTPSAPPGQCQAPVRQGSASVPLRFIAASADLANLHAPHNRNLKILEGIAGAGSVRTEADPQLPRRTLVLLSGGRRLRTDWSGRIGEGVGEVASALRP